MSVQIGGNPGDVGKLQVLGIFGVPADLTLPNTLEVGGFGNGTLEISGQGTVNVQSLAIDFAFGANPSSSGTVTLSGANVRLNASFDVQIGGDGGGSAALNISNGAQMTSPTAKIGGVLSSTAAATISGANSTWTDSGSLSVSFFGGQSALTVADGGRLSVGGTLTIGSLGTVNIGTGGLSGTLQPGGVLDNGTLDFNHTDAIAFAAAISGSGLVIKSGAGNTTLTSAAGFTGSFVANAGQLVLKNALVGSGYAANSGTLRFDGATVNLSSFAIRSGGDGGVEYNTATVNGGFLRGPGTHTLLAGGTNTFNGVTSFGANIVQNSPANFNNVTNGGTLTNNAELNFDGGVNTSSGTITINNELIAQDFTNDGIWIINSGGQVDNGTNNLVCGGGSRTTLNPGGVMFLSDGTTWELNGALLVNNGEINGVTDVNFGSAAKGSGSYESVNVLNGGALAPGNSPGPVTITGGYMQADGGSLLAELSSTAHGIHYDSVAVGGRRTSTERSTSR